MSWSETGALLGEISKVNKSLGSGLFPQDMRMLSAVQSGADSVNLSFLEPADTVIDGQNLLHIKGVIVVMKEGTMPANKDDGTVVINNTNIGAYENAPIVIPGLVLGHTYCFRAFIYSDHDIWNVSDSAANTASITIQELGETVRVTVTADDTELFTAAEIVLHNVTDNTTETQNCASGSTVGFYVTKDKEYYISCNAINGYSKSADTAHYTAQANGERDIALSYSFEMEVVTVTLTADDETDLTAQSVVLHDVTANTTSDPIAYHTGGVKLYVPNGHTYYVSASEVDRHVIRDSAQAVAVSKARTAVTLEYKSETPVYGFRETFTNTSPLPGTGTISYPAALNLANADFTHLMSNSSKNGYNSANNEGGYKDFNDNILKNFPYIVNKDTGEAIGQLKSDDQTKYIDGSAAPITTCDCAMSWFNKIYMKETYSQDGTYRDVLFAASNEFANTADFKPIGFKYDNNGTIEEVEGLWLPMFYMDNSGKTRASVAPIHSKTCDQEKGIIDGLSSINKRGIFLGGAFLNVIRDLIYMETGSTNTQEYCGYGRCNANTLAPGSTNGKDTNPVLSGGRFVGNGDKKTTNRLFYSNVLGTYQQLTRDPYYITVNGRLKVSPYYKYDLSGNTYVDSGLSVTSNSAWTYAKKTVKVGDFGSIPDPASKDADSSTGLCDGQYYNTAGVRVALRLGHTYDGLIDGLAYVDLNVEASYAYWACGVGRVLVPSAGYKPLAA